ALQKETGKSIIIVTHDLGVVVNKADRVAAMYAGEVMETGTVEEIFYESCHSYTWVLLQSMPNDHNHDEPLIPIKGYPPDAIKIHKGCPFASRCPYVMKVGHGYVPKHLTV